MVPLCDPYYCDSDYHDRSDKRSNLSRRRKCNPASGSKRDAFTDCHAREQSFYVTAAAGKLVLGIYDSVSGGPGHLLASTGAFTPVVGWNTQPVTSPVALAPGTDWLAYLPSDNGVSFGWGKSGQWYYDPMTFSGSMPGTFVSTHGDVGNWSLYATLIPGGTPSPTPSPTPTSGKPGLKLFGGVANPGVDPSSSPAWPRSPPS